MLAAAPLDHHQRHALNHYVLTGHARHLDGYQGEYDSPSDDTPPHETDKWRKQAFNQAAGVVLADFPSSIQPRSIPAAEPATPPRGLPRRKSSGQQSPGSGSTLPTNSRTEPTAPRDIYNWRQTVPIGCPPPEHIPWTGQVSEDDSVIDLAPDPDAMSAAATPSSLPPASGNVEIYQWRYENYVDWWRNKMATQQTIQGVVSPPPQINEIASSSSSNSSVVSKTAPKRAATAPAAARSVEVMEARQPPTLTIPPPPPAFPEPQVIRVVEIPSVQVPPAKERRPSHDNMKRVYYRLISPRNEPIPVRDSSRMIGMSGDKSLGVLFLENPTSYRVRDLMTHILSRECSHTTSPGPTRTSPRLQKKFAEQNGLPPSLRSPTGGSFAVQQQQSTAPVMVTKAKIKLYYDMKGSSGASSRGRLSLKRRRLKENDLLPSGVGRDEGSALIVELVREEVTPPVPTVRGPSRPGPMRRGMASMIRGLASGIRSVGDGLAKCADCLSGSAARSKAGSRKGQ
ncbi:hypothetical protein FRC04_007607 [Tulasnella sp. 424]|nr:hypothetical protein FRC04_007607 [Tulasnella sp. 424]KAG8979039.1 hypothetical protein FRC05_009249 [Tulasnella sp. 425]